MATRRVERSNLTIKNCFEKSGIKGDNEPIQVEEDDLEFEALVNEFTTDISAAEYANFNENVPVSEPMINEFEIDWRQRVREDSINAIQNPEIAIEIFGQNSVKNWILVKSLKNEHLYKVDNFFKIDGGRFHYILIIRDLFLQTATATRSLKKTSLNFTNIV